MTSIKFYLIEFDYVKIPKQLKICFIATFWIIYKLAFIRLTIFLNQKQNLVQNMKLYALFALAVSVAAIRVQTNSKTQMKADLKNKMHEALKKIETSNLMK